MRREESMDVTGFITKLWKTIFKQKSPAERTTTHPSPAWIRERVHIAIGEEALQSNSDEIYRQWLPSSTPFSSPSPASVGPTKSFPHGKREENEQTHRNRVLEEREHEDMAPGLLIGWLSDPGIKRRYKPNEDSLFAAKGTRLNDTQPQPFGLFIVADGMGGHLYGQEASQLSIQTMVDRLLPTLSSNDRLKKADFRNLLIEGVQMANQVVYQRNQERGTTMGTTLIAALVVEDSARSRGIIRWWRIWWSKASYREGLSTPIPNATRSIAAWEPNPPSPSIRSSSHCRRVIPCSSVQTVCGRWSVTPLLNRS